MKKKPAMTFKNFWVFTLWLLVILYLSFTPLSGWPQPSIFQKLYIDKVVHIFMYSMLSLLLLRSLYRQNDRRELQVPAIIAALMCSGGLGVAIEFLQPVLTMFRQFEWLDMLANAAGALTGFFLYRWFIEKRNDPTGLISKA
jgi:VanZ family protein